MLICFTFIIFKNMEAAMHLEMFFAFGLLQFHLHTLKYH